MASLGSSIRRTIFFWYVGISDDGITLDNTDCDKYNTVSHAHLTQTAPRTTPSRFFTLYRKIPDKFPSSVVVISPTPVGQALVCQRPWTDPSVIRCARILLGENCEIAKDAINRHRMGLLKAFKSYYKEQMDAEIDMYGHHSYFKQT